MASPQELNLLSTDKAASRPGAPDLTSAGSFARAPKKAESPLPVIGGNGDGAAATGATASAATVHSLGLRHAVAEVMVFSPSSSSSSGSSHRRVLLRRRRKDDELAPDTFDATASAHLLSDDNGDPRSAAARALRQAGLPSTLELKPVGDGAPPEHHRLEFPLGAAVENVVVHSFEAEVAAGSEGAGAAAADGCERVWLDAEEARAMLSADPAVVSPFLAVGGMKRWFG
jgi:hypothetical protein